MKTQNKLQKIQKKPILEVQNISKKYRKGSLVRTIFEKINFILSTGEILGIIGKSGSGKTLMIQCILGLETLDSGSILFQNQKISELSKKEMNDLRENKISLLLRQDNIFDFLTVNENLNIFIDKNQNKEKYNEIVTLLDLDKVLDQRVENLDWIDYQRVSLATALLRSPEILLLDEPTGNMTAKESEQFMNILKEVNKKTGIAMIVFSHDSNVALSINKIVRI